ncbi:MAG: GAF domain-containing protein [Anaerolineae bacterium]|nr:GAF domain-containing protein [Anaerolineae bacterium]
MSAQAVHVLQQEIARLKKENEAQQTEIESLKRCVASLTELYWAIQWIEKEKDLPGVIGLRLRDMMQAMDADDGSLLLLDEQTDELVFQFVHGSAAERLAGHRIAKDVGVAGWVMQNGEPAIVNNPKQDWRFSADVDREFTFLTRSMLCVPMMRNARPIGVIEMINKKQREFTELDAILTLVLGQFVTAALDEIAART